MLFTKFMVKPIDELMKMDDWTGFMRNDQKAKFIKKYKGYEDVENHDRLTSWGDQAHKVEDR